MQNPFHSLLREAQGTDGLLRGNLTAGVMAGKTRTSFILIHLSAFERWAFLKPWLNTWLSTDVEYLAPEDWLVRGHDLVKGSFERNIDGMKLPNNSLGSCVWCSPPCLAEVAVEELQKARHKRTQS